jgi:hypothetical protein
MVTKAPSRKRDDTPPKTNSSGSPARFKGHPRSPARFKERELARALRAAKRAGNVESVQLNPDGTVRMILAKQAPIADSNPWDVADSNPWDEVHAANEKRPA